MGLGSIDPSASVASVERGTPVRSVGPRQAGAGESVMFLLSDLTLGGSERKIVRVANGLAEKGRRVCLAYLNAPESLRAEISSEVAVLALDRRGRFSVPALRRLSAAVAEHSVGTLFSVNLYPSLYAALVKRADPGLRWNALINTTQFGSACAEARMLLYGPVLRGADRCVFGSGFQERLWTGRYRLAATRAMHIYNGVDEDRFDASAVRADTQRLRTALGLTPSARVIGTVGVMRPEKSHDLLLESAVVLRREFPTLRVLFAGDGERRADLEARCRALGLDDCAIFLGAQADVRPALALMEVFVLTSTAVETFSNAALEAMSMGRPVVLSDLSGAREMVEEGENGFVTAPGDVHELVGRLRELLGDAGRAREMGRRSRARLEQQFTFRGMLEQYDRLVGGEEFR